MEFDRETLRVIGAARFALMHLMAMARKDPAEREVVQRLRDTLGSWDDNHGPDSIEAREREQAQASKPTP